MCYASDLLHLQWKIEGGEGWHRPEKIGHIEKKRKPNE